MSSGYVYILSNISMPGILKIGKTTRDVNQRADELYQTGVPTPFKVEFDIYCPDCGWVESKIHEALKNERVSVSREFFKVPLSDAIQEAESAHREQVEEWLDRFIPDQAISDVDYAVDPSAIDLLASEMDAYPPEIADAFTHITADELRPALSRARARRDRMALKSAEIRAVQS